MPATYLLGDSLYATRFLPALTNGVEVVLTGYITRELGGDRGAIFMAGVTVMLVPIVLG